ncbi:U-box domain-containing protein 6-like isoform X2 [Pyrus x bretschneideri]|uniref:U-box domain-containing protein 6-like isoform X2 n=1 Tax=Pyrus x bretschneideri TaxID=225117 RepID=UPI00202E310D|nr:U-box domain-containing protein 6-like isoform X2 [Pyrus x bretschneideri]
MVYHRRSLVDCFCFLLQLHRELCKALSAIYCKIMSIFPSLEAARPRSKSGIQALCSLHVAPEKSKNVLQHCVECSKLYLAITGDSVPSKFEKARCALMDSLRRVEDIVPQSIGCQKQGNDVSIRGNFVAGGNDLQSQFSRTCGSPVSESLLP